MVNKSVDIYKTPLEVGIVGVGSIGRGVAHELLKTIPNVELNLYTLHPNVLRKNIYDIISSDTQTPETILEAEKKKSKIRIYKNITGETTLDAGGQSLSQKKKFLDSDFIIISARNTQYQFSDFKKRDDEYHANKDLIKKIAEEHQDFPGIVVVVSGPLELILEDFLKYSKIPTNRILGQSHIDTLRFRRNLINKLHQERGIIVTESEIHKAVVLGEHSKYPVPVYSLTRIQGKRVLDHIKDAKKFKEDVLKELTKKPAQIQFGKSTTKDVRGPYIATCKTIEALLTGEEITASAYDGECFISSICSSKQETIGGRTTRVIKRDESILNRLSALESRDYKRAKKSILRRLRTRESLKL